MVMSTATAMTLNNELLIKLLLKFLLKFLRIAPRLLLSCKTRHLNSNLPKASANLPYGMSKEFELALGKLELGLWTAAVGPRFRGVFLEGTRLSYHG